MAEKSEKEFDVAIIGAGVVGCAIARELAKYQLNCALIEAGSDVGVGTSKANTALLHTGFDAKPDTLERELLIRGYKRMLEVSPRLGIPIERTGAVLVAWTREQIDALPGIKERAYHNNVTDVKQIGPEELYELEPNLGDGALGGLIVPGESIICTFTVPLAFATQAVVNGVHLYLNHRVKEIKSSEHGGYRLVAESGEICTKFLVNAAGLHSDEIDNMLGHNGFTVTPRRGEEIVFDKHTGQLIQHIILAVPTPKTKGVLISPTIYGNVLLGPTAEDIDDKSNTATSASGLEILQSKGYKILPSLANYEVTATYAGLRAATEHVDYQIQLYGRQKYVCVGGIRSTGLSASLGIAEYVVDLLDEAGLTLQQKESFEQIQMPNIGEAYIRPYQDPGAIEANPDNGRIVCFCERVTQGEIKAAAQTPIPASSLDGLRRRTRATMGRCQGNYCLADVLELLAGETDESISRLIGLENRK